MDSLKIIQTLAKLGRILSKIIYICCIVGFCGCVAGMLSLAVGAETLKLGGVTLHSILQQKANLSVHSLYAIMVVGMLLCAGEGVLAKFAEHYFLRELTDGTPFDLGGAKELFRLGVLTVSIPLGTQLLAEIAHGVLAQIYSDVAPLELKGAEAVGMGGDVHGDVRALSLRRGAEEQGMSIDFAQKADLPAWLELVRGVRAAFPGLETEEALAEHGRIVRRFIAGKNAVCAKEGGKLAGALLFCRERGEICFLAVDAAFRRRHIAERMLRLALDEMAGTGEIRVVSYRAEDERGAAARAFYRKMGFEAGRLTEEFGCPVQELLLRRH